MDVNEIFYSLEGEGKWQGYPTIFIRLSGCNLKCSWCDTDHYKSTDMGYAMILREIREYPCRRVKITGGEPLTQDNHIRGLTKALKDNGYITALETNGTIFDWNAFNNVNLICMDIKPPSSGQQSNFAVVSRTFHEFGDKTEFKIVISNTEDMAFAETYALFPNLVLMPNTQEQVKGRLIAEMKDRFPEARFGLRLHEVLQIR